MTTKQDALHVLRLWETPGVGRARLRDILGWLDQNRIRLADFIEDTRFQVQVLKPEQVDALQSNLEAVVDVWKSLDGSGVGLLTSTDADYPRHLRNRLGEKAPPVLFVMGNRSIIGRQ